MLQPVLCFIDFLSGDLRKQGDSNAVEEANKRSLIGLIEAKLMPVNTTTDVIYV